VGRYKIFLMFGGGGGCTGLFASSGMDTLESLHLHYAQDTSIVFRQERESKVSTVNYLHHLRRIHFYLSPCLIRYYKFLQTVPEPDLAPRLGSDPGLP
jgi:hypothetical protein